MTSAEKEELLQRAKQYFTQQIAEPHLRKEKEWSKLSTFNVNPFLDRYLARFYTGTETARALAQTLILPRALGTSITTSFGSFMQKLIVRVLLLAKGENSDGFDLVFVDALDGRTKYCQLKSGPKTINKDDIQTIARHFIAFQNRAKQNHIDLMQGDLCVAVLYGTRSELSGMYARLETDHSIPVFVGQEFWHHLTGESDFYAGLIKAFREVAAATDASKLIEDAIEKLAAAIEERNKQDETAV